MSSTSEKNENGETVICMNHNGVVRKFILPSNAMPGRSSQPDVPNSDLPPIADSEAVLVEPGPAPTTIATGGRASSRGGKAAKKKRGRGRPPVAVSLEELSIGGRSPVAVSYDKEMQRRSVADLAAAKKAKNYHKQGFEDALAMVHRLANDLKKTRDGDKTKSSKSQNIDDAVGVQPPMPHHLQSSTHKHSLGQSVVEPIVIGDNYGSGPVSTQPNQPAPIVVNKSINQNIFLQPSIIGSQTNVRTPADTVSVTGNALGPQPNLVLGQPQNNPVPNQSLILTPDGKLIYGQPNNVVPTAQPTLLGNSMMNTHMNQGGQKAQPTVLGNNMTNTIMNPAGQKVVAGQQVLGSIQAANQPVLGSGQNMNIFGNTTQTLNSNRPPSNVLKIQNLVQGINNPPIVLNNSGGFVSQPLNQKPILSGLPGQQFILQNNQNAPGQNSNQVIVMPSNQSKSTISPIALQNNPMNSNIMLQNPQTPMLLQNPSSSGSAGFPKLANQQPIILGSGTLSGQTNSQASIAKINSNSNFIVLPPSTSNSFIASASSSIQVTPNAIQSGIQPAATKSDATSNSMSMAIPLYSAPVSSATNSAANVLQNLAINVKNTLSIPKPIPSTLTELSNLSQPKTMGNTISVTMSNIPKSDNSFSDSRIYIDQAVTSSAANDKSKTDKSTDDPIIIGDDGSKQLTEATTHSKSTAGNDGSQIISAASNPNDSDEPLVMLDLDGKRTKIFGFTYLNNIRHAVVQGKNGFMALPVPDKPTLNKAPDSKSLIGDSQPQNTRSSAQRNMDMVPDSISPIGGSNIQNIRSSALRNMDIAPWLQASPDTSNQDSTKQSSTENTSDNAAKSTENKHINNQPTAIPVKENKNTNRFMNIQPKAMRVKEHKTYRDKISKKYDNPVVILQELSIPKNFKQLKVKDPDTRYKRLHMMKKFTKTTKGKFLRITLSADPSKSDIVRRGAYQGGLLGHVSEYDHLASFRTSNKQETVDISEGLREEMNNAYHSAYDDDTDIEMSDTEDGEIHCDIDTAEKPPTLEVIDSLTNMFGDEDSAPPKLELFDLKPESDSYPDLDPKSESDETEKQSGSDQSGGDIPPSKGASKSVWWIPTFHASGRAVWREAIVGPNGTLEPGAVNEQMKQALDNTFATYLRTDSPVIADKQKYFARLLKHYAGKAAILPDGKL